MKLIVKTLSGSVYQFDNEALTWARQNDNEGHEEIKWMEGVHGGDLAHEVQPIVGNRLVFHLKDHNWVTTTPVVGVEWIDASWEGHYKWIGGVE